MKSAPVTFHYLELTDLAHLREPASPPRLEHAIERVEDPALNRRLYAEIGADFGWLDRLEWSEERWRRWARGVETWVAMVDGETAGYSELRRRGDSVLIAIFGLLEPYRGQGLGAALLTHAIRRGFELGNRVWVTTNTMDAPHALTNYEARGMKVFRTETAA